MKRQILWRLSVACAPDLEEAVAELLTIKTGEPAVCYTDLEKGNTTVSVYLKTKANNSMNAINAALGVTWSKTPGTVRGRIRLTKLRPQDWAESWKRHFKPLEIGRKLLVQPSWSRRRPKPGQALIVLDPGMSFGTGQHPTTSFCLREIARLRKPGQRQSLLDAGTGSGILAVCAAKLGYQPVEAFDIDPDCLKTAHGNATRNRVSRLVQISHGDVSKMKTRSREQYWIVCANLLGNLLVQHSGSIAARVKAGGFLIVAGILREEFDKVQTAYERAGLRLVRTKRQKEWQSGCFTRRIA